jgi:hypothetical protein
MQPRLVFCRCCGASISGEAITCPRCGQPDPSPRPGDVEPWKLQAQRLATEGHTIEAIKLVREQTALGLKEAKDLVESLMKHQLI